MRGLRVGDTTRARTPRNHFKVLICSRSSPLVIAARVLAQPGRRSACGRPCAVPRSGSDLCGRKGGDPSGARPWRHRIAVAVRDRALQGLSPSERVVRSELSSERERASSVRTTSPEFLCARRHAASYKGVSPTTRSSSVEGHDRRSRSWATNRLRKRPALRRERDLVGRPTSADQLLGSRHAQRRCQRCVCRVSRAPPRFVWGYTGAGPGLSFPATR